METYETYLAKRDEMKPKWFIIDAKGKVLGRLASQVADVLRGKNKPIFTPNVDCGDFVIVINSKHIKLTGNKLENKIYYKHTDFPGGLKMITAGALLAKKPEALIKKAVKNMLPKNKLSRSIIGKLNIYPETNHPHTAQNPVKLELKY